MKRSILSRLFATVLSVALCLSATLMLSSCQTSNRVRFEVEDYGEFIVELYPDVAPITVENFKSLVSQGFYDGLTFHRVIKDFMIQGGGFTADGKRKESAAIKGEFLNNNFINRLPHTEGVISMARGTSVNSASCQFFIVTETSSNNTQSLDGRYAAFGKVVEGMDVVKAIAACEVKYSSGEKSQPVDTITITKVSFVN